jgi:hypothetical protein
MVNSFASKSNQFFTWTHSSYYSFQTRKILSRDRYLLLFYFYLGPDCFMCPFFSVAFILHIGNLIEFKILFEVCFVVEV